MHLIDQELSGINQLGAIVVAISGYLCGKQLGQLCLTVDRLIVCGEKKNSLQREIWLQCMEIREKKTLDFGLACLSVNRKRSKHLKK